METPSSFATDFVNGIRIDWAVPIPTDDGTALCADVFRPDDAKQYPVIMGATPHWKWLPFQDDVWDVSRLRILLSF